MAAIDITPVLKFMVEKMGQTCFLAPVQLFISISKDTHYR